MTVDTVEAMAGYLSDEEIEALDFSDLAPAVPLDDDGVLQDEGFWHAFDGLQIFWQSWQPEGGPTRGVIALMHGFGEHSSRYDHVAGALCRAGYAVLAIDARGHGRSTGKRAHVQRFEHYVRDYDLLKMHARARWPELDLFCFGHSNGGLIVLQYALTQPDDITGFVVTSPFCGFALEVPAIKAAAGDLLSKIWPSFTMPNGLDGSKISHVQRVVDKYDSDPLDLKIVSARYFTEAKAAQQTLLERAGELEQSFLFLVAGGDEVVDPKCAEDVFHKMGSGDREMEIFPKLYHEILNEEPWDDIVRRMLRWMERHRQTAAEDQG
ncbi:alpha/beta hydrolase [Persicimonas caeni]|uniref:Alpha/beta hydrolase n=1 Tax=Persicimonas caeni TaxID=2292766 RepID=A0A4Y6PSH7_PERCE|nr:alpha/beta hydrolase [Persicimonas caeni]QDG50967.1 alpha/beta hydrolase [Persicimonas caeni]QED32188.1 lysophospholipase [Persicimonas caeni]